MLYLTPAELEAMAEEFSVMISRWSDHSRFHKDQHAPHDTDDRQQVFVFTHAFPITDKPQRSANRHSRHHPRRVHPSRGRRA